MADHQIVQYKKAIYDLMAKMMADEDTNWSFYELYNLPIVLRKHFFDDLIQRLKDKKEVSEKAASKMKGKRSPRFK